MLNASDVYADYGADFSRVFGNVNVRAVSRSPILKSALVRSIAEGEIYTSAFFLDADKLFAVNLVCSDWLLRNNNLREFPGSEYRGFNVIREAWTFMLCLLELFADGNTFRASLGNDSGEN